MDITMPSVKFKGNQNILSLYGTSVFVFSITSLFPACVYADLDIKASAEAEMTFQDVNSEEQGELSLTTVSLLPKVNAIYESRTFSGTWTSSVTHLERDKEINSRKDTYGEYSYSANWAPFDRFIFFFEASGGLTYQNTDSSNYLVSDFLSNADSLSKTRTNRVAAQAIIDRGDWVRAYGTASYSALESESSTTNTENGLDNSTMQFSGSLQNSEHAQRFIWEFSGTYQDTERNQTSSNDYISRTADGYVDTVFIENWAFRITASHEANQISNRIDTSSSTRKFNSYGAGLTYRQNADRYISVTANSSDSEISDEGSDNFIGFDLQWALSSRTSVAGSYGKRFYGDSASADIKYNSKYFRTSLSYSEDVTNTSQLLTDFDNLGVFICPTNSSSISDCFQPNSLSYTPSADEQFIQLTTQNVSFDDNIILLKSTNFQAGYDFSRLTLAFSWRYDESNYLDEDRLRRTYSFGTTLAYKLGSYMYLNSNITYANIEERSNSENIATGESDNWNASLGLERKIGRSLTTSIDYNYIEKSGDLNLGGQFGANYTDQRITLSIIYNYM